MSNPNTQTPEEKEFYWLNRITSKAQSIFPAFIKELTGIIEMANHALSDDNKKKLRVLIANDLGRPLMKLEIKDENPAAPQKPTKQTKSKGTKINPENNEEHLRSDVLPDNGSEAGKGEVEASPVK